jgi:hypothetical protein
MGADAEASKGAPKSEYRWGRHGGGDVKSAAVLWWRGVECSIGVEVATRQPGRWQEMVRDTRVEEAAAGPDAWGRISYFARGATYLLRVTVRHGRKADTAGGRRGDAV